MSDYSTSHNFPLVSIITVVFNGERYLAQTINSVLNQSYKNIEYIIIDGGSNDGSVDIIKKHSDSISYWVSESDRGLYDAMNKGISYASGELIGIINSDDWYELDTVETVVNCYIKHPHKSIFHGDMWVIPQTNYKYIKKYNNSIFKMKYYGSTFNHPTFFVKREEYKNHMYNSSLKSIADVQFILEALLSDNNKFYYIDRPLANFRLGGVSGSLSKLDALRDGYIARRNAGFPFYENIFTLAVRIVYFAVTWTLDKIKAIFN